MSMTKAFVQITTDQLLNVAPALEFFKIICFLLVVFKEEETGSSFYWAYNFSQDRIYKIVPKMTANK